MERPLLTGGAVGGWAASEVRCVLGGEGVLCDVTRTGQGAPRGPEACQRLSPHAAALLPGAAQPPLCRHPVCPSSPALTARATEMTRRHGGFNGRAVRCLWPLYTSWGDAAGGRGRSSERRFSLLCLRMPLREEGTWVEGEVGRVGAVVQGHRGQSTQRARAGAASGLWGQGGGRHQTQ